MGERGITADKDGKIPVKEEWQGEELSIVQKSNGKEKSDSPEQRLTIPVRPEALKAEGREFTIIRSHDGTYALLPDLDDNPDTITISTDLFSAYAIAYEQADQTDGKCGLCHICPTFLGICYFIWIAVIVIAVLLIIRLVMRRKKKGEERGRE